MATNTNSNVEQPNKSTYGGAAWDLPEYDLENIIPDAYPGAYEAKILAVKWRMTQGSPPRPMIIPELKIVKTFDEDDLDCQKSVGMTVSEFIVLAAGREGNGGKQKLRALRDALDIQTDLTRMTPDTVKALHNELRGKVLSIWIDNKKDSGGNMRTRISYTDPHAGIAGPMASEDDEAVDEPDEEEDERRKAAAKKVGRSVRR